MNPEVVAHTHAARSSGASPLSLLMRLWRPRAAVLLTTGFTLMLALAQPAGAAPGVPLFDDLGAYSLKVTTKSPEAQQYFDQGLRLLFGFNHGMAVRSFEEAVRLDPECAMAHWGVALACGPHINFPLVPPDKAEKAWAALAAAKRHSSPATQFERDLIQALSTRYASPQPEDRTALDRAYADSMRQVWRKYPNQPDAGVLFAEAMMDLRPWDQWAPTGTPQPGTGEIIGVLDAVLAQRPDHPFANHLYVHAMEASPHPERALRAADRLLGLQPGLAHNVHMPSHIYVRTGSWDKAITSNTAAINAHRRYRAKVGPPKDLVVIYAAHNQHMLAYAAMMTGQQKLAMEHLNAMVEEMPQDFVKDWAAVTDAYIAAPYEAMVRFGMWDEILSTPDNHPAHLPFTKAMRRAVRAIAYAAKDDPAAARDEQVKFLDALKAVPAETKAGNNTAEAVFAVVKPMVEGEILVREKKLDAGFAALRDAVKAEDALHYDEPPAWILPVRHSLGANLMAHGRHEEAEQVYRQDLKRLPSNGWSLFGLADALDMQGREKESAEIHARFAEIWRNADLQIASSCMCQPGGDKALAVAH